MQPISTPQNAQVSPSNRTTHTPASAKQPSAFASVFARFARKPPASRPSEPRPPEMSGRDTSQASSRAKVEENKNKRDKSEARSASHSSSKLDQSTDLESQASQFVRQPCLLAPAASEPAREVARQVLAEHQVVAELLRALRVQRRAGASEVRMSLDLGAGRRAEVWLREDRGQIRVVVEGDEALEKRLSARLARS